MDDFPPQTLEECSAHVGRHGPGSRSSGGESALKKVDFKIPKYAQSARRASEDPAEKYVIRSLRKREDFPYVENGEWR